MTPLRLRTRLLLVLLGGWLAAEGALALVLDGVMSRTLDQRVRADLARDGKEVLRQTAVFLERRHDELRALAGVLHEMPAERTARTRALAAVRDAAGFWASLRLIASDGTVLADTDQLGIGDRLALPPGHGLEVRLPATGSAELRLRQPLAEGGVLQAVMPLERLHDRIRSSLLCPPGTELRLIASDGSVLFSTAGIGEVGRPLDASPSGMVTVVTPAQADGVMTGWRLSAAIPQSAVDAPLAALRWGLVLCTIAVTAVGVGLILWIAQSLARPLGELAAMARGVGAGTPPPPAPPAGASAEVAAMHAALTEMAGTLGGRIRDLEGARERLRLATTAGGIGVWDLDLVHGLLVWDDGMHAIYGTTPEQIAEGAGLWRRHLHPDDRTRAENELTSTLRGE